MNLFDWPLKAGVVNEWYGEGRYLRILSAPDPVSVTTDTGIDSKIIAGIGADLAEAGTGKHFNRVAFKSDTDQTITVIVSAFPTTDSRLSGDVDINGLLTVVNAGGVSYDGKITALTSETVVSVADTNTDRICGTLVIDTSGRLWLDNTVSATKGIPYTANKKLEIKNTAALYFYPSADGEAHFLEDLKS